MRARILIALSVLVLAFLNYGIAKNQRILDRGEVVLLKLAPVDPRSLMQGDFMRLRYALERTVPVPEQQGLPKRGYMVIAADADNVAQFLRFHSGEPLQDGERLLHYKKQGALKIMPDSFMFQEGRAAFYEEAEFGVFKFEAGGKHLLVGLADEDGKTITVPR